MTRKKKKESWKVRRHRATLRHQKALEADQLRREREPKKSKGWSRSKLLGICFLFLIFLVIGVYAAWQSTQPSNAGELPPLYTLTDAEFSEFRGKVVLVDCFATWCGPCKTEIPHLTEVNDNYNSSEVVVISVGSSSDSEAGLREFKKDYSMDWPVARDTVGVFDEYNVGPIPTLIILDQNGSIHYRNEGVTDAKTLSSKIDELLGP